MIPTIGIMVGFYIITRMVSLATRTEERAETGLVKALAMLTILVTVFCIVSLFQSGSSRLPFLSSSVSQPAETPTPATETTVAPPPLGGGFASGFDPGAPIQLELAFSKDSWVEAVIDGTNRFSELRVEGETLRISAKASITLTLGNAKVVKATVNGKHLDFGDREVVRDFLIDKNSVSALRKTSG